MYLVSSQLIQFSFPHTGNSKDCNTVSKVLKSSKSTNNCSTLMNLEPSVRETWMMNVVMNLRIIWHQFNVEVKVNITMTIFCDKWKGHFNQSITPFFTFLCWHYKLLENKKNHDMFSFSNYICGKQCQKWVSHGRSPLVHVSLLQRQNIR